MKVVLDTNIIISGYGKKGSNPALILEKWAKEELELLVSEAVLTEYDKSLRYEKVRLFHRLTDARINEIMASLRQETTLIEVQQEPQIITADPSDNKFLACAIAGNADYIISGDKHLLALGSYQGIKILSPAIFLTELANLQ
jgi:uncharacterized protein